MNKKSYITLGVFFTVALIVGWRTFSNNQDIVVQQTISKHKTATLKKFKTQTQVEGKQARSVPKRDVASIKPKITPQWEKGLNERLNKNLAAIGAKAAISPLGKIKLPSGKKEKEVVHVHVSIDAGKGNVSSYEAYVNPTSGSILKTWNQTRFENQKPVVLNLKPFTP